MSNPKGINRKKAGAFCLAYIFLCSVVLRHFSLSMYNAVFFHVNVGINCNLLFDTHPEKME